AHVNVDVNRKVNVDVNDRVNRDVNVDVNDHFNVVVNSSPNGNGCPVPHAAPAAGGPSTPRLVVRLDRDLCQGHATCVGEAPEVFRIGADGKVETIIAEPVPSLHARVAAAEKFCPTRAIRLTVR